MKLCLSVFIICYSSILLFGQNNEGIIIYEDKFNIHRSLPPRMEGMKDRIPEFRISKKIMHFKGQESTYKAFKEDKEEVQEFKGEGRRRWGNREDVNEYYTNMTDKTSVDRREFFGKEFLIDGTRESPKWKITPEQKKVGSYLCQKAIIQDTSSTTIAWFTPMIPIMTGPDEYFGLPGAILHVDVNDGERLITAQTIELRPLEEDIQRPTKGKKVTQEEFEKIQEEKTKEMEEMYGGKGGRYRFRRD